MTSEIFTNESEEPPAKKTPRAVYNRIPCPWHAAPPHTLPERWAVAADLEEIMRDGSVNWEDFSRFLATSCYVLSGPELKTVATFIHGILQPGWGNRG